VMLTTSLRKTIVGSIASYAVAAAAIYPAMLIADKFI
jgi:hypothetical protein